MTQLEQEIFEAMDNAHVGGYISEEMIRAAAGIAKQYIEDAWDHGELYGEIIINRSEWLVQKGVTK
jgi:hypothetical protein